MPVCMSKRLAPEVDGGQHVMPHEGVQEVLPRAAVLAGQQGAHDVQLVRQAELHLCQLQGPEVSPLQSSAGTAVS